MVEILGPPPRFAVLITPTLDVLRGYAAEYSLDYTETEALEWAKRRGARSGRVAWHFIVELAGRAGKAL